MKYLKEYKEHNEYYTPISEMEYLHTISLLTGTDDHYDFTPQDISQLSFLESGQSTWGEDSYVLRLDRVSIGVNYKGRRFDIMGNEEEWFFIKSIKKISHSDVSTYYKCDQFSAVIKFFQEVKEIIDRLEDYD